jgi:DNA adenine methylase
MSFLRYPGGKRKLINFLLTYLPKSDEIKGKYVEPFIGGGSVFFQVQPKLALLADLNKELIDLYKGIRLYPHKIWKIFQSFPGGKINYYEIRDQDLKGKHLSYRAARTLYLNRTCFKGMWRHGSKGNFNVGYGGEERRWVVTHENIVEVSKSLKTSSLYYADFESTLHQVEEHDFVFIDPPYKPGEKELKNSHYISSNFAFAEQKRLAEQVLGLSTKKNIKWLMTNSSHEEIVKLYKNFNVVKIPKGTSSTIGVYTNESREVLISNY